MKPERSPVSAETMEREAREYEIARDYWEHSPTNNPTLAGIAAIGGGGVTELHYRQYEEIRHLRRIVRLDPSVSFLEIGCGNGRWIEALAPLVEHYIAVDFSKAMLDVARERASRAMLRNVSFVEQSAATYTPDRDLDVVYLSGVSQYLHDADFQALVVRVLARLKPGGVIVDRSTVHRLKRQGSSMDGYFSIYRTAEELIACVAGNGLELTYHRESYRFLNFPEPIQRTLARPFLARAISAAAPFSYGVLRGSAALSAMVFGRIGEVKEYSHDFFVFRRARTA